jgi:hypothetical protein
MDVPPVTAIGNRREAIRTAVKGPATGNYPGPVANIHLPDFADS